MINDFNFVVAGIATFAATVGYACTRRLSASFVGSDSESIRNALRDHSKADLEHRQPQVLPVGPLFRDSTAIPTKRSKENLKRKVPHDGFEEPEKPVKTELGYPHNLAHIYPPSNKRLKTPPTVADDKAPAPIEILEKPTTQPTREIASSVKDPEPDVETPAAEPPLSPSPVTDTPSPLCIDELSSIKTHSLSKPPTPSSPDIPTPPQPQVPSLQTTVTPPVPAIPKSFGNSSFSGGFSAFAGSSSTFSTVASNTSHSALKSGRSIWSAARSDLTPHQNHEATKISEEKGNNGVFRPGFQSVNVLEEEAKPPTSAPSPKHSHLTGEEDEDVQMELRGVKLYVKRGAKPYGEGFLGHLKLLCNRASLEERILFRREPLWKVSMNVRVQPTVRCAFVPQENALKFILKENVESSGFGSPEASQELVIYVLKPGRSCSKQDFKDFAQALSENAHFAATEISPKSS